MKERTTFDVGIWLSVGRPGLAVGWHERNEIEDLTEGSPCSEQATPPNHKQTVMRMLIIGRSTSSMRTPNAVAEEEVV